mmetsp:Transcript_3511/g.4861  ORF Transcript_3511/g.4861 Transcript_3511/m.4861 type:complete len:99 (-) Transcript_3511:86-382(-)
MELGPTTTKYQGHAAAPCASNDEEKASGNGNTSLGSQQVSGSDQKRNNTNTKTNDKKTHAACYPKAVCLATLLHVRALMLGVDGSCAEPCPSEFRKCT